MIHYTDNYWVLLKWRGSVVPRAVLHSLPTIVVSILLHAMNDQIEDFFESSGLEDVKQSFMWNALTSVIALLLAFRTRQALGRFWEGTGLLHQMRGEWFDASSCLMTFSRDGKVNKGKHVEVMEFRHTLLRLMSLMHAAALEEISATEDDNFYEVLDVHGLDNGTLKFLKDCKKTGFNRVEALQHMIQVLVTHNHHAGVLTIPPPILSRIYQTLSRGLVNLLNARKIKDTMFPFPYAQIITLLLIVHSLFTPVMFTQAASSYVITCILCFLPVFGMFCLNFIALELEMPFGKDQNDLPLRYFQTEMNEALLMLIHDMADHLPHTSERVVKDFDVLQTYLRETRSLRRESSNSCSFMEEGYFGELGDFKPQPALEAKCAKEPNKESKPKEAIIAGNVVVAVAEAPNQAATRPTTSVGVEEELMSAIARSSHLRPVSESHSKAKAYGNQEGALCVGPSFVDMKTPAAKHSDIPVECPIFELPTPQRFEQMYSQWLLKMDMQVNEMKRNTDTMNNFARAFANVTDSMAGLKMGILNAVDSAEAPKETEQSRS